MSAAIEDLIEIDRNRSVDLLISFRSTADRYMGIAIVERPQHGARHV